MKIYRLTREGKRFVRIPSADRVDLLDHIYEFKTATIDELIAIDKDARDILRKYKSYVEVLDGF